MDDPQRLAELVTVAISTALMVLGAPPLAAMVKSWRYRNGSVKERRRNGGLSTADRELIVHEVDDCVREAMGETLDGFKDFMVGMRAQIKTDDLQAAAIIATAIHDEQEKTRDVIRDEAKITRDDILDELRRSA